MNILVCLKQVPDFNSVLRINEVGSDIERGHIAYGMNPYDEVALEAALQLASARAEQCITVLTLGPERAKQVLNTALAMGADKAIHVLSDETLDSMSVAKALAPIIAAQSYDLILCGKQAIDTDAGIVGPALAGILGWPQCCDVRRLSWSDTALSAETESTDGLLSQNTSYPVLMTIQLGYYLPRFPSIKNRILAKTKAIDSVALDRNVKTSSVTLKHLEAAPDRGPARMFSGSPTQQVQALLKVLHEDVKVL